MREPAFSQCTEVEETLVGEAKVLESILMISGDLGSSRRKGLGYQFEDKKGQSIGVKAVAGE